jgi:hypothetical protein
MSESPCFGFICLYYLAIRDHMGLAKSHIFERSEPERFQRLFKIEIFLAKHIDLALRTHMI